MEKIHEIAPTVRRQFLDANYIDRHERGKLQQRLRNARLATFDASIRHGTEAHAILQAAREKEEQISKEVAVLSSSLDSELASLRGDSRVGF